MLFLGQFFRYPEFFWLFLLVPVFIYLEFRNRRFYIKWQDKDLLNLVFPKINFIYLLNIFLKLILLSLFIIPLAWPGSYNIKKDESRKWIDIVFALDISKSMIAEDVKPSRIEAAKKVIIDFISKLDWDRIWMTIFAWKPFISIPLTFDYLAVSEVVKWINTDSINQNIPGLSWTAIWDALIQASDSLTKPDSLPNRSKVIILVTDWEANLWVDPKLATKYCFEKNIKIYSVWIWDPAWVELYTTDQFWNKKYFLDNTWNPIKATIDENTLRYISNTTLWEFYLAKDSNSLSSIFQALEKLNKTEIKIKTIKSFDLEIDYYLNIFIFVLFILLFLNIKYHFE